MSIFKRTGKKIGIFCNVIWSWNKMFRIALIGRPNVGKSSLFNVLLGYRRTIVLDQPGTTLDLVTEKVNWAPFELTDTQGIFGEGDTEVLHHAMEKADAII